MTIQWTMYKVPFVMFTISKTITSVGRKKRERESVSVTGREEMATRGVPPSTLMNHRLLLALLYIINSIANSIVAISYA
jgi:hypothetical protein